MDQLLDSSDCLQDKRVLVVEDGKRQPNPAGGAW